MRDMRKGSKAEIDAVVHSRRDAGEDLHPMPEIDFTKARIIRRGPDPDRDLRMSLTTLRVVHGLTQAQFAKRAKISQAEVSRAESRSDCLVSTLERYAKALGGELVIAIKINGRTHSIALGSSRDDR
jgi:hypothetical protein